MRDNGTMDKFPEVVAAMKDVVEKGGFATSVTPVSQFYFQQAYSNVMFGAWKKITEGYGKMVLGYFGKTPCEPDPEIVKEAAEQLGLQPTTETVLDLNDKDSSKGIEAAKKMLSDAGLEQTEENIFIAAACKEKGIMFLQGKGTIGVRKNEPAKAQEAAVSCSDSDGCTVSVNGKKYAVKIHNNIAVVNGKEYTVDIKDGIEETHHNAGEGTVIEAPVPGVVMRVLKNVGDHVEENEEIVVIEAMKMETPIKSSVSGTITSIMVGQGDKVKTGTEMATVG